MRVTIRVGNPAAEVCDVLVAPVGADRWLREPAVAGGALAAVTALGDFDGAVKSTRLVHVGAGLMRVPQRVLLIGAGDGGGDSAENGRLAGGATIQGLSGMTIRSAAVVRPAQADARFVQGLIEGLALGLLPVRSLPDARRP